MQVLQAGVLILTAAPAEARAVAAAFDARPPEADFTSVPLRPGLDLVRTGVGKVNAAVATARCTDPSRHRAVLNVGVCGVLPQPKGVGIPTLTQTVLAQVSVYADEGILTPTGWTHIAAMGFAPGGMTEAGGMGVPGSLPLLHAARERLGPGTFTGTIATVSTCSGTAAQAAEIVSRTGAIAEAMEGAAVAHTLCRLFEVAHRPAFLELRTVSNSTGDRDRQRWDLSGALHALTGALRTLIPR